MSRGKAKAGVLWGGSCLVVLQLGGFMQSSQQYPHGYTQQGRPEALFPSMKLRVQHPDKGRGASVDRMLGAGISGDPVLLLVGMRTDT